MRNHCILELLYSCGLRVSELTELKCSDLFFEKGLIRVKGKGDKMRWAPIANSTIKLIREYQNIYRYMPKARGFEDVLFLNKTFHFHLMAALKAILHFLGRDCLSYAEMLLRCCLRYNGT